MTDDSADSQIVELTADIVSAYVSNNTIVAAELPALIDNICTSLGKAAAASQQPVKEDLKLAVSIKRSITPDYLVCLDDGKKFKSLKRHIRTHYDMSPDEYREKWGLPYDYPMVAPNYAKARSELAKKMGLGKKTKR